MVQPEVKVKKPVKKSPQVPRPMAPHLEELVLAYEARYHTVTGNAKFKFNTSEQNVHFLNNFYKFFNAAYKTTIGIDFIRSYLEFAIGATFYQKHYFRTPKVVLDEHGDEIPQPPRKPMARVFYLNKVLSKATMERWLQSNARYKWGMRRRVQGVQKSPPIDPTTLKGAPEQLQQATVRTRLATRVLQADETERERFLNQLKGYVWCGTETTLAHPQSKHPC